MLAKRRGWKRAMVFAIAVAFLLQFSGLVIPGAASAATTSITITKYASDRTSILEQKTVTLQELRDGMLSDGTPIPIMGDGSTHYYHQGPVFVDDPDEATEQLLRWDVDETTNWDTKDMGALKGTAVTDLCDLVGGMAEGDELQVKSSDGWYKYFAYKNVYQYPNSTGPMVICWYKDGKYPDSGYSEGMRLVWFAEATYKDYTSSIMGLPPGYYHVFGNWDWHEAADEKYWYYYWQGGEKYPTTTGLSGQVVKYLNIYSTLPAAANPPALTADSTGNQAGQGVDITFAGDAAWEAAITGITVNGSALAGGRYTVTSGNINIAAEAFPAAGDYEIVVSATGYKDAKVTQTMTAPEVAPTAAFVADNSSGTAPLVVQFTDMSTGNPTSWAWDFNNDGTVDSNEQNPIYEYSTAGTYSVKLSASNAFGSDEEIKIDYITVTAAPAIDVLYQGEVALTPGETFNVTAYNSGTVYTISETTPLGALQAAAAASGFTYDVTDKNYAASCALLLDNIGSYKRKSPGYWYAYINDVYKDGYNNAAGALNLIELTDGDKVEFYYAAGISDPANLTNVTAAATAAVKIVVSTGVSPTDWTLQLSGAKNASVSKAFFEEGLACPNSGHQVFWTDSDGNVWGGVPLFLLVGMVDDDPDEGPNHYNFNEELAAQNYEINVVGGDGWSATFDSAAIANNDGYIVANTLNGAQLPLQTESGKGCWPLHLKGSAVLTGQQIGNIVRIELSGLPEPVEGWTLEMAGDVADTITQAEFEAGMACAGSGHYTEWTDSAGNVWSGVPLWVLLGVIDDIETGSHWTFNDDRAAAGYSVNVTAGDGYTAVFSSSDLAHSSDYIVANKMNGDALSVSGPLRLVGPGVAKADGSLGGKSVGNIAKIEIPELQTPEAAAGSWNLKLKGKISDVVSQAEFEAALACANSGHLAEWTDAENNVWTGMPLWFLAGWVDDRQPHNFNHNQAMAGYTVVVKASDGYAKEFASTDVAYSGNYIVANKINGQVLGDAWPLRLVGPGVTNDAGGFSGSSVGKISEIELTSFGTSTTVPQLHIVKYADDKTTVLDEKTVDYLWMQNNLDVIGDGTTVYRFEGITNNPDDVWDEAETYPGGYKIANAVKGTKIKDLCDAVGGMGAGTEIVLVASDGYETVLPYSAIYTDPAVQERQGDAILAWWADGKYVPDYADGMRLFFTPGGDHVYGQWDMHETLPSNYWHYYYSDNVQYPSCAGLSAKYITGIKIYSTPESDWTLSLDGRDIGGLQYDVSKTYFEQALACQFGSNHKASYTDAKGRIWEGMPLWFLAGFVDDADQHSSSAFNDALAEAGYRLLITASDGASVTLDSADIIRNSDYIVANSLNGVTLSESDSYWPLRLVGPAVSGAASVSRIISIKLIPEPLAPPALTADSTGNQAGQGVDITFAGDAAWEAAITGITVNGSALAGGRYTVTSGNINIAAEAFPAAGDYEIVVSATGYKDAKVTQTMLAAPSGPEELNFGYFAMSSNPAAFKGATDSVVDSQGRVYISDFYNNRVVKFDAGGNFLAAYGTQGSGAGEFLKPSGLAIDPSDNIYVADTYNNRIVRFKDTDDSGSIESGEWECWGGAGTGAMQFSKPMGVYAKNGLVYVADTYNHRLAVFDPEDPSGSWRVIGGKGTDNGQFKAPYDLALDSGGNIWVSDTLNNRVQKLDAEGNYIEQYGAVMPYGLSISGSGWVFTAERQTGLIKCLNNGASFGGKGSGAGLFTNPVGVNADASNRLWIVDVTSGMVQWSSL